MISHLNIGAGRIVWQDIVRIDESIRKKRFAQQEGIVASLQRAKSGNGRLHLLGLVRSINLYITTLLIVVNPSPRTVQVSDGGVHSHINHLLALLESAKAAGVPEVYVHFFGDGRDTAPRSAIGYLKQLNEFMVKESM